jgi:predicted outer membrane protein
VTTIPSAPERFRALWGVALLFLAACAPAPVPAPAASPFNSTDTAWIQLMIPMNEQLLPALALAPPELAPFAAELKASHEQELGQLRRLRERAGLSDENPHAGHQMPGLVSEADLAGLRLDPAGLPAKLREHLEQSALLARGEQDSGADQETRDLAASIGTARAAQTARLGTVSP